MKEQESEIGTITGTVIIILVLLVGAFYFFEQRMQKQNQIREEINKNMAAVGTTSDEITDLEKDVNSINTDTADTGINNL